MFSPILTLHWKYLLYFYFLQYLQCIYHLEKYNFISDLFSSLLPQNKVGPLGYITASHLQLQMESMHEKLVTLHSLYTTWDTLLLCNYSKSKVVKIKWLELSERTVYKVSINQVCVNENCDSWVETVSFIFIIYFFNFQNFFLFFQFSSSANTFNFYYYFFFSG